MTDLRQAAQDVVNAWDNRSFTLDEVKVLVDELRAALAAQQTDPTIRCPERLKPGGCQLHNLHCGWPACNEPPKEQAAQPQQAKPSRSQKMRDAGFTPRDNRLECDECGAKVTAQFMPLHACVLKAAQPVAHDMVEAHGVRSDGTTVLVGSVPMPPSMKMRELAQEQFGPLTEDGDGNDADCCLCALEMFHDWMKSQATAPAFVATEQPQQATEAGEQK